MKDIRFIDKQNTQLGKKASLIEFNDLLHFDTEFITYMKDYQYPFKNDIYKLRNGARISKDTMNKANDFSFIPTSNSESFGHFLKFIHDEYGINLICDDNETADESRNLDQGVSQMNETLRSQSHWRMQTVLSRYQSEYKRIQNPQTTVEVPVSGKVKNQMFLRKRFFGL